MKIKFLSSPKIPSDMVNEWEKYIKDSVHEMSDYEAGRWLRRGMADVVSEVVSVVEEKKEEKKPEPVVVPELKIAVKEENGLGKNNEEEGAPPVVDIPVVVPRIPRTR